MFHVGQQVVCVDDGVYKHIPDPTPLRKNAIYEIAGFADFDGTAALCLAELDHLPEEEKWFMPSRFRPVRKTDISIFTAMLRHVTDKVRDDA